MGKIEITLDELLLKQLVISYLQDKLGEHDFNKGILSIETKSELNYKAEWESAKFRATYKATL
jgi:hypothetical protein